jgi:hypothetical protein
MRTLPLQGIFPDDRLNTLSRMYSPNDEALAQSFFCVNYAQGFEWDLRGAIDVPAWMIEGLINAPGRLTLNADATLKAKQGCIAGYVLQVFFLMWKYPQIMGGKSRGGASLNKAIKAMQGAAKSGFTFGDGEAFPTSETAIRKAWTRFKDVAHLYAALEWRNHVAPDTNRTQIEPPNHGDFFNTALYFQKLGLEPIALNTGAREKVACLDASTVWRVPEETYSPRIFASDTAEPYLDSPVAKALIKYSKKGSI